MVNPVVPGSEEIIDCTGLATYNLKLRKTWSSAKAQRNMRQGWLIRLHCGEHIGYGDCAPLPEMGTETLEEAKIRLQAGLRALVGLQPSTALSRLDRFQHTPAVRCALETALVDLLAQHAELPLARWLNRVIQGQVAVNAALGGIDDGLQSRAFKAVREGFTVLKIKLGLRALAEELQSLQVLADRLPQTCVLRLDVNGAWDEPTARRALNGLRRLPVEALEEPLKIPRSGALQQLQSLVPWPLALDESLRSLPLKDLLDHHPVKRLVLKPMILGGLLPSLQMARRARGARLECVVTTTVDSAAGVWAALHLAASLDDGLAHGLNTTVWLAEDIGPAPVVQNARMAINETPGLGFTPYADKLVFKTP